MSKSIKTIGIIAAGVIILGIVLFITIHKPTSSQTTNVYPTPTVVISTPTIAITPTKPASSSKFTPEIRAKARSEFIASCKVKVGQQYAAACECGADYLAAHYTDEQLEKAYIEYHFGNKIPSEVQAAYDACNK